MRESACAGVCVNEHKENNTRRTVCVCVCVFVCVCLRAQGWCLCMCECKGRCEHKGQCCNTHTPLPYPHPPHPLLDSFTRYMHARSSAQPGSARPAPAAFLAL